MSRALGDVDGGEAVVLNEQGEFRVRLGCLSGGNQGDWLAELTLYRPSETWNRESICYIHGFTSRMLVLEA